MLGNRRASCKNTDRTSENTTPVIFFWFMARFRLSNEHLNNGDENRREKS